MGDRFDVFIGRHAQRHRAHAHAFHIVEFSAARRVAKIFELLFDVPFVHAGDVRSADCRISRPILLVARHAGFIDFFATRRGIRRPRAAPGKEQVRKSEAAKTTARFDANANFEMTCIFNIRSVYEAANGNSPEKPNTS